MGISLLTGAKWLGPGGGGTMDSPHLPPRVVWHSVESPTGLAYFNSMADYLRNAGVWPHLLYDPETDSLGQFCRLDQSARALRNDGSTRTNRTGEVCIQIEVLGRAAQPFTEQATWRPGKNFQTMMNAIRSWDIPDLFPMGPPPKYPGASRRDRSIWLNQAGHYCHANVPGNNHGDPGAIDPKKLWVAAGGSSTPDEEPTTPKESEMTVMGGHLVEGFDPAGTLIIPQSVPEGREMFLNIGADMGRVRGRVDIYVTGQGWRRLGEFAIDQNTDLAFYELPRGTRKVNIKRLPGEGIADATPAAWNIETV